MMRAFVAAEVPAEVRQLVAGKVRRLEPALPAARWVSARALHFTLQFVGEVSEATAALLGERLSETVQRERAFEIELAGGGTFPLDRPGRVAWIGVAQGTPLNELASKVRNDCSAVCDELDEKPFSAHLTVARCRKPWPRWAVELWSERCQGPCGEPFTVSRVALMRSHLEPRGARYEVIRALPLGSGKTT